MIMAGALGDPPSGGAFVFRDTPPEVIEAFVRRRSLHARGPDHQLARAGLDARLVRRQGEARPSQGQARLSSVVPMAFPQTRPRRLRATRALRTLVRETELSAADFVLPLFVAHGLDRREPIEAMPGVDRLSISHAVQEAGEAAALGIPARPAVRAAGGQGRGGLGRLG